MIDYLSDEWLGEADRAVADLPPLPDAVTVGIRIIDGGAVIGYSLVLGPDRVSIRPYRGDTEDPSATSPASTAEPSTETGDDRDRPHDDVRLTMPMEVAVGIARGQAGAQRAFLDGHIQLGGDTTVLLGYQQHLAEIDDRLSDLRSRTRFP